MLQFQELKSFDTKTFVSYGFHKSAKYQKISETGKWVRLIITQSLKEALSEENIVNQFKNEIDKLIYSKIRDLSKWLLF